MSVSAMESQYIKTIMIQLVNRSDFILSDHETGCKSFQQIQLILRSLRTVTFPTLKAEILSGQKSLAYSLRIFVDNFSLLSPPQRVLAAWLKIPNYFAILSE